MYYANIKTCDIANGPGVRTSLFVSGCTHHCPNCFNEVAWDFSYGEPFTDATIRYIIEESRPFYVTGLSLLGGEPMEPVNQPAVLQMCEAFKKAYPDKTIWCYTGFVYDVDLMPNGRAYTDCTEALLQQIDVLVDGPFVQALYDISLRFRGSSNQRLIDLHATRESGHVVEWTDIPVFSTHTMAR